MRTTRRHRRKLSKIAKLRRREPGRADRIAHMAWFEKMIS